MVSNFLSFSCNISKHIYYCLIDSFNENKIECIKQNEKKNDCLFQISSTFFRKFIWHSTILIGAKTTFISYLQNWSCFISNQWVHHWWLSIYSIGRNFVHLFFPVCLFFLVFHRNKKFHWKTTLIDLNIRDLFTGETTEKTPNWMEKLFNGNFF